MIPQWQVVLIKRLLEQGVSQRAVAKKLGVSRGTVDGIANGTRPDYETLRRARQEKEEALQEPLEPPVRCPECGGLVHMPCRLCAVRRWILGRLPNYHPLRQNFLHIKESLQLNLREKHLLRYEEVSARRLLQGDMPDVIEEPLSAGYEK